MRLRRSTRNKRVRQRTGWVGRPAVYIPRAPKIDPELVAEAFADADLRTAEANRLPVTGRCHDCDRPIAIDRRFCGPCLTKH